MPFTLEDKFKEDFDKYYNELTAVLDKTPDGMYGCTSFDDIEEIHSKYSALETLAKADSFLAGDPRLQEVEERIGKRRAHDFNQLKPHLMRAIEIKRENDGSLTEESRKIKYETGAICHCWGPPLLADERLSKLAIGDGTYEGYVQKDPKRMGDGRYALHYEHECPR